MQRYNNRKGLSVEQIKWASQHDWFRVSCMDENGSYGVEVRNDNPADPDPVRFFDFVELKAWAGY